MTKAGKKDSHHDSLSPSFATQSPDIVRTPIFTMWTLGLVGKARSPREVGWVIGGGMRRREETVIHVTVTEYQF